MTELPDDIPALKAIIKQLLEKLVEFKEEINSLKTENTELRRRLGLDSTNSHKPPSSDGYKKKSITPGVPRENHSKGGQKGHKGKTLKRVNDPDQVGVTQLKRQIIDFTGNDFVQCTNTALQNQ